MRTSPNHTHAGRPAVLVVVCLALFFGVVAGSAVAVVLPEIGDDLAIADGDLSWVLSGFLLTYGVAIPFYGRLANRFGTRRLFLFGVTTFAVGSLLAACSTGLMTLLAARTVQAAGGAAVPGLGMTLASRAYPESRRGVVLGVVAATMGVAAAAGPLAAGVISEIADWRWLFLVTTLAAVSVPLGLRHLDRDPAPSRDPLDLIGGILLGTTIAGFLFVVTRGGQAGWTDPLAVAVAALSVVAAAVLVRHQRRTESPFLPTSLVTNPDYLRLTALGFAVTGANLAAQIGMPLLFSDVHGRSSLQIGIALLPAALVTAVVGLLAGRLADRSGPRRLLRSGVVTMIVATVAFSVWAGSSVFAVAAVAVVFAAGFALVNTPLTASVSLLVSGRDLATALSLNTMMFFVGGSFGAAIFTSIALGPGSGQALNPMHDGAAAGFSDAFLALLVPLAVALVLGAGVGRRRPVHPETADTVSSPSLERNPA